MSVIQGFLQGCLNQSSWVSGSCYSKDGSPLLTRELLIVIVTIITKTQFKAAVVCCCNFKCFLWERKKNQMGIKSCSTRACCKQEKRTGFLGSLMDSAGSAGYLL